MKERRDRKEMKADQTIHHEELAGTRPSEKAKESFRRPAYQARGMIREQGRQMEGGDDRITEDGHINFLDFGYYRYAVHGKVRHSISHEHTFLVVNLDICFGI